MKFENVKIAGLLVVVRGLRRITGIQDESDSGYCVTHGPAHCAECEWQHICDFSDRAIQCAYIIGEKDQELLKKCCGGFEHMIKVYVDITASGIWWGEVSSAIDDSYLGGPSGTYTICLGFDDLSIVYSFGSQHYISEEWDEFYKWVESLPYSWLITGKECEKDD